LKALAREQGLWNLFLSGARGGGLTNLEYAQSKEIIGRVLWSPEVFSAPDTGNIEVLWHYGTPEQQDRWLRPLMEGGSAPLLDDRACRRLERCDQHPVRHPPRWPALCDRRRQSGLPRVQ